MATDLTLGTQPDEAFLVFRRRGVGGIQDLHPGSKLTIVSTENPRQSIVAEIATPADIILHRDSAPDDFYGYATRYVPEYIQFFGKALQHFVLRIQGPEGDELKLTPKVFITSVVPVVVALASVQRILFGTEPTIRGITQNSPVNVSLEGAGGLYEKIATDVIPWRRERAKEIVALEAAKQRSELDRKKAEVLQAEAQTSKEKAEAEAAHQRAREARADADMKEVALTKARFQLACDMVESMYPNAAAPDKMQKISQLMPEIALLTSRTEISVGSDGDSLSTFSDPTP